MSIILTHVSMLSLWIIVHQSPDLTDSFLHLPVQYDTTVYVQYPAMDTYDTIPALVSNILPSGHHAMVPLQYLLLANTTDCMLLSDS